MSTPSKADDLKKLTVPQLKALCKEKRITGYSKLGKSAIIQKLIEHSGHLVANSVASTQAAVPSTSAVVTSESIPTVPSARVVPAQNQTAVLNLTQHSGGSPTVPKNAQALPAINTKQPSPKKSKKGSSKGPQLPQASTNLTLHFNNTLDSLSSPATTHPIACSSVASERTVSANTAVGSKRPYVASSAVTHKPSKKRKILSPSQASLPTQTVDAPNRQPSAVFKVPAVVTSKPAMAPPPAVTPRPRVDIDSTTALQCTATGRPPRAFEDHAKSSASTSKRFKPLSVKNVIAPSFTAGALPNATPRLERRILTVSSTEIAMNVTLASSHLDFPLPPIISLVPITMPPSLSQRKLVQRYAILLSGISNEELGQCTLVSRMFRYAAYLSAGHRLKRHFHGRRLAIFIHQYAQNMTNMWPYLHRRERELLFRKQKYHESFLAKVFKHTSPIKERLWSSPDHEKQITVAVRFLLTRLWFLVSVGDGNGGQTWAQNIITDAQELVKGEIWTITIRNSPSSTESLYVLESTCEVVGHPPPSPHPANSHSDSNSPFNSLPLRADWSAYIAHRLLPSSLHDSPPLPLLHHLSWTNHEEYDKGISRLWLKRIENEGGLGVAKTVVAERYILACIVGNSVSGRWMSSTEMAQDFSGLPSQVPYLKPKSPRVHLFLPAHHHIESLHFTTPDGSPLHPALAVVQTPGREYYILKDNGMQVGCEEDGVAIIWMQLLGCSSSGKSV